ncbi:hypothetical protein ACQVP2_07700 [Methylobacterium aquaticum]|uniref:hypothetical protein n=1 Tax=Methylobacterium aquaticum TaxID=270351 RepID=UPI003D177BE4
MTFRAGDIVTFEGRVPYRVDPSDRTFAVAVPGGGTFWVEREAIIAVRAVVNAGDLVEHTLSGREGVVRHVHEDLAWVAWSDKNSMNTVTPVGDLIRKRTAAEMAALAEPEVLPEPIIPVVPDALADVPDVQESEENPFG